MYSFRRSRNIKKLQIDSCMNTNHKHVQNTLFMTLELFKEGCLGYQQSSNSCLVSWLFIFVFSRDIIVNLHLCKDSRVHVEHIIAYKGQTLFYSHCPLAVAITILFYLRSNMSIFLLKVHFTTTLFALIRENLRVIILRDKINCTVRFGNCFLRVTLM